MKKLKYSYNKDNNNFRNSLVELFKNSKELYLIIGVSLLNN